MAQVGAASLRRVTRDRETLSGRRGRRAIGGLPVCKYFSRCRVLTNLYHPSGGTEGSNPASSSEESNANLIPTTFSQPAVRSLRNRLTIARSTKCPLNPSCVGRL